MSSYRNVPAGKIRKACLDFLDKENEKFSELKNTKVSSFASSSYKIKAIKLQHCSDHIKRIESLLSLTAKSDAKNDNNSMIMLSSDDAQLISEYLKF